MHKNARQKNRLKGALAGYAFVGPQLLFFAVFTIYPIFEGVRLSLYKSTAVENTFVGLQNYINLFHDEVFLQALFNTLFLVVVITAGNLLLGLLISLAIFDKRTGYVSFVRSTFYLPVIVSTVVMAMVWKFLLNPANGLVNYYLGKATGQTVNLLGNSQTVLWVIAFVTIIASVGTSIIMYVASMNGISTEMLEAAKVDGASKLKTCLRIIIPLVKPTTLYLSVTTIIAILKLFVIIQLLSDGGPNNASMTLMYYLYRNAFSYNKMYVASAVGVIMFILAVLIAIPQFVSMSEKEGR
jgi:multiple sugar transport system permease protein